MVPRVLTVLMVMLCAGCGRQPEGTSAAQDRLNREASPGIPETSPGATTEGSPGDEEDAARRAAVLTELTQAVRRFGIERQRVPKDLEELVTAGYLERVPEAPGKMRFAIDKNLQVYLAPR